MQLKTAGQVCRYEVDGKPFLHICAWSKNQVISRPSAGRYPVLTCADAKLHPSTHAKDMRAHVNAPLGEGEKGRRGEGEKGKELSRKNSASDSDFDAFWDAYGKKIDRAKAVKAFKSASKKTDTQTIIHAAREHAAWHVKAGTESRFIKHPTSWLNAEAWSDERPAPVNSASKPSTTDQRVRDGLALAQRLAAEEHHPQQRAIGYNA